MIIPGNRILVQPTEPIRQLPSGLYLPEIALQKPNTGKVVITGTKADSSLIDKTVMYNPITAVEIDGKHLIHVTEIKFII
jgi:co-chaperonin GroES (HSP10)